MSAVFFGWKWLHSTISKRAHGLTFISQSNRCSKKYPDRYFIAVRGSLLSVNWLSHYRETYTHGNSPFSSPSLHQASNINFTLITFCSPHLPLDSTTRLYTREQFTLGAICMGSGLHLSTEIHVFGKWEEFKGDTQNHSSQGQDQAWVCGTVRQKLHVLRHSSCTTTVMTLQWKCFMSCKLLWNDLKGTYINMIFFQTILWQQQILPRHHHKEHWTNKKGQLGKSALQHVINGLCSLMKGQWPDTLTVLSPQLLPDLLSDGHIFYL